MANAFWAAFVVSAVLATPCLALLRAMKSKSIISPYAPEGHQAKAGTPNMGGIFVVAGLVVSLAISGMQWQVIAVVCGFAIIGFLDDYIVPRVTGKRGLGWIPKLFLELAAASVVLVGGTENAAFAVFFVLAFANAVNFSDGLDGLAGSLLVFSLIPFVLFWGGAASGLISLAVMGAVLPFLFLNAPPARVFLGDVGSLPLGAAVGLVFASAPWQSAPWPWVASAIFVVELVLVPIQIAAVKTIKRRVFPATPIHHAFEKVGWPESRVVWTFVLSQIVLSALAATEILVWKRGA